MPTQWFFAKDGSKGKMHGPVTARELKRLAATGGLTADRPGQARTAWRSRCRPGGSRASSPPSA